MVCALILIAALLVVSCGDSTDDDRATASTDQVRVLLNTERGLAPFVLDIPDDARGIERTTMIIRAMVEGIPGQSGTPVLPVGSTLERIDDSGRILCYVRIPEDVESVSFETVDEISSQFIYTLEPLGYSGAEVLLAYEGESFRSLSSWTPELPPVPQKPEEASKALPHGAPGLPDGYLSGKSIFLSPGHGWYCHDTQDRWLTQRFNTNNICEDFSNGEAVLQFLVNYLRNAGAYVWTTRERDLNTNEVIVDNVDADFTGSWSNSSATTGYYGSDYAYAVGSATETATATFTPNIPEDGYYWVYVWYTAGANRSESAKFLVNHAGGTEEVVINQQHDGFTFRHLGRFYFLAGSDPVNGSVTLSNEGSDPSSVVIADAVRFGGGVGSIDATDCGTSGKPRWEESGRYFVEYMGCPSCATGTVSAMPRYAKWESETWEDSIYFSWHTNAPNPGTGTSSFVYSAVGWDGAFTGVAGSQELQNFVHSEVINDIRAGWDAGWVDRGKHTADFGEVNPYNNDEMPACLIEIAFHDTPSDAEDLKEPGFRNIAARAVYQGIAKYFADRDGETAVLLPEPPQNPSVTVSGLKALVAWEPPVQNTGNNLYGDPADGYRVYVSPDGKGFALDSEITSGTSALINMPYAPTYLRITAFNEGGESFPTETLVVHRQGIFAPTILLVNGFDRLNKTMNVIEYNDGPDLGWLYRGFLEQMNSFDYVRSLAPEVEGAAMNIESASNEAMLDLNLNDYRALLWIAGEESTADESFSDDEQVAIAAYLDNGGALLVSGSEVGWDLDQMGDAADQAFFNNYLHADYTADDAATYSFVGVAGTMFAGINGSFDDGSAKIYDVNYPDVLTPIGDAVCVIEYDTGDCAAVAYEGTHKTIFLGFPIETIVSKQVRTQVVQAALVFLADYTPPTEELSFFRVVQDGSCIVLEWGVPQTMNAVEFLPLRDTIAAGTNAQPLTNDPIPADNLYLDYVYHYRHCGAPQAGYYFLDVQLPGSITERYGPVEWE